MVLNKTFEDILNIILMSNLLADIEHFKDEMSSILESAGIGGTIDIGGKKFDKNFLMSLMPATLVGSSSNSNTSFMGGSNNNTNNISNAYSQIINYLLNSSSSENITNGGTNNFSSFKDSLEANNSSNSANNWYNSLKNMGISNSLGESISSESLDISSSAISNGGVFGAFSSLFNSSNSSSNMFGFGGSSGNSVSSMIVKSLDPLESIKMINDVLSQSEMSSMFGSSSISSDLMREASNISLNNNSSSSRNSILERFGFHISQIIAAVTQVAESNQTAVTLLWRTILIMLMLIFQILKHFKILKIL